jgi:hypothetical protein
VTYREEEAVDIYIKFLFVIRTGKFYQMRSFKKFRA